MALHGIEKRLEQLVEGAFARAFRSELRPVELGRRMIREIDAHITLGIRGERVATNHVTFTLNQADYDRFAPFADALATELAEAIEEHARDEKLALKGPAMVDLLVSPRQRPGQFKVATLIKVAPKAAVAKGWLDVPGGVAVAVVEHDPVTIGRLPECDIVVSDSNTSRRHAEVRCNDGTVCVVDLGSMNGTKLNGRGVPADEYGVALSDGDLIAVGPTTIRYSTSRLPRSRKPDA